MVVRSLRAESVVSPRAHVTSGARLCFALLLMAGCAEGEPAESPGPVAAISEREAPVPANVYFGDLHVHTVLSPDAFLQGTPATPDDAYRYAKGEAIDHVSGRPIQAKRPIDFLAVTDHAEYLGLKQGFFPPGATPEMATERSGILLEVLGRMAMSISSGQPQPEWVDRNASVRAWDEIIAAADRHYDPGHFTTLIGFEWSATPAGRNLHRNVIFGPTEVLPEVPFSVFDSPEPEGLWRWMDQQRAGGSQLLAIPHNSNLSDGTMFARTDSAGRPIDAAYAASRARNEPLVEVTQIKGTSETDPVLSPQDEFAGFEIWATKVGFDGEDRNVASSGSYVRDALKTGLEMQSAQGFNPYRYGLIGSTDSHSASTPVEEDNYSGKGIQDTTPDERLRTTPIPESVQAWGASGLAAVWAQENTREAIFAALARKETYATTGPRIRVRFFGSWQYDDAMLDAPGWLEAAYAGGVPMGGSLQAPPAGAMEPRFLVRALKDPEGANLDRVQIVKGWVENGKAQERVFDVALSDPSRVRADASIVPVGSTVAGAAASYTNEIGAAELAAVWRDTEFAPEVEAFYYVRALEIPTPRWSTHDAKTLGIEPLADLPVEIQERAFSSPIWYSPR